MHVVWITPVIKALVYSAPLATGLSYVFYKYLKHVHNKKNNMDGGGI